MSILEQGVSTRATEHKVHELIVGRWSPRAMTGESITKEELFQLFEAAKWAPSSYNEQPWRILYALRGSPEWNLFFNLMVEFNQSWTKDAAALLVFLSRKVSSKNNAPLTTHSFDTGAAWQSLALQGASQNLVVHGMSGFDYEKARKDLEIPDYLQVEAMAAVGRPAPKERLPQQLQEREAPSPRRPLAKTVAQGKWTQAIA